MSGGCIGGSVGLFASGCLLAVFCLLLGTIGPAADAAPSGRTPGFPLRVSPDHRYLVDQRGRPFFVMGDTPWFLQKLKLEDVRHILDDRRAKGFNTLFLEILDDSNLPSRDSYGNVSFQPELDITHPVEAYWKYADTVVEEATKRGFFIIMSDLWYGAGEGLWMHHVTPESASVYGHFLGKRYRRFDNLMWMHVGDRNPDEALSECARRLALAIRQEAPRQLHTVHLGPGTASAVLFGKDNWLGVDMGYTYGASYLQIADEYKRSHPIRPIILGETGYEDEPNAIELLPDAKQGDLWDPYRIRRNAYWAVLSGAWGYCAGTRLWRYEPNWREVLNARSTREAPLLAKLLAPFAWWKLVPDFTGALVTAGGGTWGKADHVATALAGDGGLAMAYLPAGGTIEVDLGMLRSDPLAYWFDPTNGSLSPQDGEPLPRGRRSFTAPGRNSAGEPDWVLVLTAK